MTTDLTIQNLFEGKAIRIFEKDNDIWIPVSDLAEAWGTDRTTPYNLIIRNKEIFDGMHCDVTSQTTQYACVNERGLYLLMGKISASRLKHPAAKESIIRFQRWVPELIQKYRKKEIAQVSKGPDYTGIIEKIKFVNELSILTGWNRLELQKEVLIESGMRTLTYHIEPAKPIALPSPPKFKFDLSTLKPKDYLTATDIGERIGKSAEEVHIWMSNQKPPLIIRDDVSGWRLTEYGKEYGEERAVELTGGTIVWRIKWKKDVLRLFNIHDHEEMG